ncbi:MAG: Rrf2 family transcriptional regulator [Gallionellaceae bacterium]|nr:MAG: Rrf2 family transcriptional regulator [Gallionellaceae bacterium]
MQLTVSTDIALRTLIYLGRKDDSATIQEVADAFNISKAHLMKVVMTLVAENLLISERGRNGGVRLALNARKISVGSVVRLMENSLALVVCMKDDAASDVCPLLPDCRLKGVFIKAQDAFFASLDQTSLADLL